MKDKDDKKQKQIELAKDMINAYRKAYADVDPQVLKNLNKLKDITSEPKQDKPDASFKAIEKNLGQAESEETLRQERWHGKTTCPSCKSRHVMLMSAEQKEKFGDYKYHCKDCEFSFNDDSGTLMEGGMPPLSRWMFCWYLLGCTDSLQYIANKLGLDLPTVELMVRHMQRLFKSEQPLTHFMSFEEWSLKHGKSYQARIKHEIAKTQEMHRGENPNTPTDTAELRRQKQRAREPHKAVNRPKPRAG